jgi:trimeric autotransporter adhesin
MSLKSILMTVVTLCVFFSSNIFGQSKSAVQFYDTTGQTKTGKVGWTGDAATGHFFIQVPGSGDLIKSQTDGISVNGTVTATKFSGDGSTLTNLPAPAASTVGSVTGLQDSLNAKASAASLTSLQSQVGAKADSTSVNTKLSAKANASDLTALQTVVGGKADTVMLKKKADTTWVLTKIGAAGGGTITGVTAGSGLTGGGTTGTVSLSIANGSIDSSKIAAGAVTDAKIAGMSYSKLTGVPTGTGTITGVTADSGLSGGGTTGVVGLKLKYGSSGTAATVSRSDHMHTSFDSLTLGTLKTSGNVGIGITNPSQTLDVKDAIGIMSISTAGLYLTSGTSGKSRVRYTGGTGTFSIRDDAAGIDRLNIDNNGNVGIGTTTQSTTLNLSGDYINGYGQLRIDGSTHAYMSLNAANNASYNAGIFLKRDGTTHWEVGFDDVTGNAFYIYEPSAYRFVVKPGGNVGIGTTNPDEIFETDKDGDAYLKIRAVTGNNQNTGIKMQRGTATDVFTDWAIYDSIGMLLFNSSDNAAGTINRLTIAASGNIGIGEPNPTAGKLVVAGNVVANGTTLTSDRRFKTDIVPIDSSLSKVSKLQGVYYNWDRKKWPQKNFTEGKQIGLIAQEVEKVVPEVVNTDKEGYKSLSYDKLTAVLIEAVKEQQKQIETLKAESYSKDKKIADQQQSIIKQEDRLAKIDKMIEQLSKNSSKH